MIVDSMTKQEVMTSLLKDFVSDLIPHVSSRQKKFEAHILQKSAREKKKIYLDWISFTSKNNITYKYRVSGNSTDFSQEFVCEFIWRERKCYAEFFDDKTVLVFQQHCLDRFNERVLMNRGSNARTIFYHNLMKNVNDSFYIVLPSPKRPASYYLVLADALFLGDYIIPETPDDPSLIWCNTCISLNEAHSTQTGIMHSFDLMRDYIKRIGFNPVVNKDQYYQTKNRLNSSEEIKTIITELLKMYLMMYQLQASFNFSFYPLFKNNIEPDIEFLKKELNILGIDTESLSPFSENNGFAIKGEIDYREE